MSELADVIVVSRSGLTYRITQLEKAGLVRREKCPSDERGILAILTPDPGSRPPAPHQPHKPRQPSPTPATPATPANPR